MIRFAPLLVALALMGPACARAQQPTPQPPQAGTYRLEQRHASLTFRINHLGLSRTVGRFNSIDATLVLDAAAPERSTLTASAQAASIDTGIDNFDNFLRSPNFLDAAAHPEIRFVSRSIERTGDSTARVTGALTLRGATHPATLDVTFNAAMENPFERKQMVGFSAVGAISRAQWGLTAFAPQVGDEIELFIEAEFALAP